jgi:formate hydrogenlyase subunit 3/multisubunit Na+/H+ antiporter MnhD subunit
VKWIVRTEPAQPMARSSREKILESKLWLRVLYVALFLVGISAILARPAMAVIRLGSVKFSQLAQPPKMLESAALVLFGIGFLALASVVRRFRASTE